MVKMASGNEPFDDHDDYNNDPLAPRERESLMQRRLRAARGTPPNYRRDDYTLDEEFDPRTARRREPSLVAPAGGGGCAQAVLYLVLGGLVALLLVFLFLNNAWSTVMGSLGGGTGIDEIIATPTPDIQARGAAIVDRIQQFERLQSTSYSVETVIEARIEGNPLQNLLAGDRLLLIAHGDVEAGIDLSKLGPEDVTISSDGLTLTMQLPPVEIFNVSLNNDRTRVFDRQQGLLAPPNRDLESEARRFAEDRVLEAACESDILARATRDSEQAMERLLSLLDFQHVEVIPGEIPAQACPDLVPAPMPQP